MAVTVVAASLWVAVAVVGGMLVMYSVQCKWADE